MAMKFLFPLVKEGTRPPLFIIPPAGSTAFSFVHLARSLRLERPVYSFEYAGMTDGRSPHASIEEMASAYLEEIRPVQETGPYNIGGHCWGGMVALKIAEKLESEGGKVAVLVLLESLPPSNNREGEELHGNRPAPSVRNEIDQTVLVMLEHVRRQLARVPAQYVEPFSRLTRTQIEMKLPANSAPLAAPIVLLRTTTHPGVVFRGWEQFTTAGFAERIVPGDTFSMLRHPYVGVLGEELDKVLHGSVVGTR